MKKLTILLVITFSFLFSNTSWGEWIYVTQGGPDGRKYYYDKDRVRKNGKSLYFWLLHDFKKPDERGNLSSTSYVELYCSIFRYKGLDFNFLKNQWVKGD